MIDKRKHVVRFGSIVAVLLMSAFGAKRALAVPAVQDVVMYEVNLRAFSQAGDLAGVTARLDEIQSLGANTLWLMPIHPVGQVNSAGGLGSPYSVQDYHAVGSEYGSLSDLTTLIDQAHQRGMYVLMDWVANHTAWDHPWITAHPDWYTQDGQGQIIHPAGTNWTDVADLNYNNQAMRTAMISEMQYWVNDVGIDGYRTDTADFVPFDFWQQAIPAVRAGTNRDLLMLAEGARNDHYAAGYDLTYGWDFYNAVQSVFNSSASATQLIQTHNAEFASVPQGKGILQFTTNHDESAWDATPPVLFGSLEASLAAYAVTVAYGGTPLVYSGQEIGWRDNIPFFTKEPLDWSTGQATADWYAELLGARADSPAMRDGALTDQSTNDVAMLMRELGNEKILVLVNTRNNTEVVSIPSGWQGQWDDLMGGASQSLGTTRSLAAYEVVVLGATFNPTFVVAGELQTEQGDASDWDVANSSLVMSEAGGIHTVTANNLANGTAYDFKIVSDEGSPPIQWGDLEITPDQLTLLGDADGSVTITVDTNQTNNKGNPVVWIDFDSAPLQVVGDFMNEAGGVSDWDPSDAAFDMTAEGNGYYSFDAVISTPGIYQYKTSFGNGWDDQVGTDGFNNDARTLVFQTTETGQAVTLFVDLSGREIGVIYAIEGDLDGDGFVGIADLNLVLGSWNQFVPPGDANADPSGDGFVGIADLNIVLGNWNNGTPPSRGNVIPEPACVIAWCVCVPVLLSRRLQH